MGNTFEVEAWVYVDNSNNMNVPSIADYRWEMVYEGDDKETAFKTLDDLKNKGVGCVRLTWR